MKFRLWPALILALLPTLGLAQGLLFSPPQPTIFDDGEICAGCQAFFYADGTTTKQNTYTTAALSVAHSNPVVADANGKLPAIFLSPTLGEYKVVIAPANDTDPPTSPIETIDDIPSGLYQQYPRTTSETFNSVTPTNYSYPPGHLYRYGAVSDGTTDASAALAAAAAQCASNQTDAAPIRIPKGYNGFKIGTVVTMTQPCDIRGDDHYTSFLWTTADNMILRMRNNQVGFVWENFGVLSSAASSTTAGITIENSAHGVIRNMRIMDFHTGIHYDNGTTDPFSSFLNAIEDSIISGVVYGIRADSNTNYLTLRNTTWGGSGASGVGLWFLDSAGLSIFGGDSESCVVTCLDIDTTISAGLHVGALITGVDFENSQATGGTIRLGNTYPVHGITVMGNGFFNGGSAQYAINTVKVNGLTCIGNVMDTGTLSGQWFNDNANVTNVVGINCRGGANASEAAIQVHGGHLGFLDGVDAGLADFTGRLIENAVELTYSASVTPNAALANQFSLVVTNGSAFTINNPTNPKAGQVITITVFNTSGGAHGTGTMGNAFKLEGGGSTLPAIATGNSRSFTFRYRGSAWVEIGRSAADVPN